MFDIISIGEAGIDTLASMHEASIHCNLNKEDCQLCFNYGDKIEADTLVTKTAHNAMNNAVGSARLALKTALYAHVGNDAAGARIKEALRDEGVSRKYIVVEPHKESSGSVVINFKGERTILVHHVRYQYHLPKFSPTKWFYLTSMGPTFPPVYNGLARRVVKTGELVACNPGPTQLRAGAKKLKALLQVCTVLFLNKEEARLLTGISEERDIKELLIGMHKLGPRMAVLTDGGKGSYASDGKNFFRCGLYPAKVVERTGAGDSFATAFVAALIHGQPIDQALRWGSVNAAGVIAHIGPQDGLQTLAQIKAGLKQHPNFKAKRF